MIKAKCPKCKKWAEGYDVVKILFGFRRYKFKNYEKIKQQIADGLPLKKAKVIPQSYCKECRNKKKKIIKIDLLDGLTNTQKILINRFVSKGFSPLGFDVDVINDKIYYFGKELIA